MISIAIDGPSGAGKSTLSRMLAQRLGFVYADTGALYRTVGLAALRAGVNPKDGDAVAALLPALTVGLRMMREGDDTAPAQHVFLNGEDVSGAIREESIGMAASAVSAHVPVRAFLLSCQRRLAEDSNVIMDGRDIGTVVLPNATLKLYLTASAEDRAARRTLELREKGQPADYETVLADVKQRDHNDSTRAAAPLNQAEDAVRVDTTGNTFEQSLEQLYTLICERLHLPEDTP